MTRPDPTLERLSAAAKAYGDLKLARERSTLRVNEPAFQAEVKAVRDAEYELLSAARAHATRWRKRK